VEAARRSRAAGGQLSLVRAAGGVVVRAGSDGPEVLLVHRPAYDDWTFPKGKLERGESEEQCALREVEEETGLHCTLGRELESTTYRDSKGRRKRVRYWAMEVVSGELGFDNETDDARWLSIDDAVALLSYGRDTALLQGLC
jgi:8-oxo-dGTP diphosphatase